MAKRARPTSKTTPKYAKQLVTLNERMDALEGLVLQQSRTFQKTLANLLDAEDDGQDSLPSTPPTQEYRDGDDFSGNYDNNSVFHNGKNNTSKLDLKDFEEDEVEVITKHKQYKQPRSTKRDVTGHE